MNKKAFTLLELLAVIVVLAIIALIVTPFVSNAIKEAREGAAKSSFNGILNAAELYYAEVMVKNGGTFEPVTITWENGVMSPSNIGFKFKGDKPKNGSITINENGIIEMGNLTFGNYECIGSSKAAVTCNEIKKQEETFSDEYNEILNDMYPNLSYKEYLSLQERINNLTSQKEKELLTSKLEDRDVRIHYGDVVELKNGSKWINLGGYYFVGSDSYGSGVKDYDFVQQNPDSEVSYDRKYLYLIPMDKNKYKVTAYRSGGDVNLDFEIDENTKYSQSSYRELLISTGISFDNSSFVRPVTDKEFNAFNLLRNKLNLNGYLTDIVSWCYESGMVSIYTTENKTGMLSALPYIGSDYQLSYLVKIPISNINIKAKSVTTY